MPVKLIPIDLDRREKLFDFHDVVDYYKNGEYDNGSYLLNKNIRVFIDSVKTITVRPRMREIVESGATTTAHEAIMNSLDKGITSYSRIYSYVRIRVQGYLKNLYKSMRKKNHAYSYTKTPLSIKNIDRVNDYEIEMEEINKQMSLDYTKKYILPAIIELTPEEKEVFYARYFSGEDNMTYKKVSDSMGIGPQKVSRLCKSAIGKIRKHLDENNIHYEDLF